MPVTPEMQHGWIGRGPGLLAIYSHDPWVMRYVVMCIDGSRPVFATGAAAEAHPVEEKILAFQVRR